MKAYRHMEGNIVFTAESNEDDETLRDIMRDELGLDSLTDESLNDYQKRVLKMREVRIEALRDLAGGGPYEEKEPEEEKYVTINHEQIHWPGPSIDFDTVCQGAGFGHRNVHVEYTLTEDRNPVMFMKGDDVVDTADSLVEFTVIEREEEKSFMSEDNGLEVSVKKGGKLQPPTPPLNTSALHLREKLDVPPYVTVNGIQIPWTKAHITYYAVCELAGYEKHEVYRVQYELRAKEEGLMNVSGYMSQGDAMEVSFARYDMEFIVSFLPLDMEALDKLAEKVEAEDTVNQTPETGANQ